MSNAWETTNDDVRNVLNAHGITVRKDRLEEIGDMVDADAVEKAALMGDDMGEQTNYAYDEIEGQLREAGVIPKDAVKKFVS